MVILLRELNGATCGLRVREESDQAKVTESVIKEREWECGLGEIYQSLWEESSRSQWPRKSNKGESENRDLAKFSRVHRKVKVWECGLSEIFQGSHCRERGVNFMSVSISAALMTSPLKSTYADCRQIPQSIL